MQQRRPLGGAAHRLPSLLPLLDTLCDFGNGETRIALPHGP